MRPRDAEPLHGRICADRARRSSVLLSCIGVALVFGAVARSTAGHSPSFAAARSYPIGDGSNYVAVTDLNADRRPDLAISNHSGTVSVLLNKGDGNFEAKRDYATGKQPFLGTPAAADLNGDGKPDLVTANAGDGTVSVLLNRGDGTFEPKRDYVAGTGSLATADLNGDGKPDLATANADVPANTDRNTVSVLLNRGDGTFEAKRDYATGKDPESIATADLNGDDKPDLVTANAEGGTVSVLLNRGDGSLEPRRDYAAGTDSLATVDLNGDGKPDIVSGGDLGRVSVLLNRGDGSFRAHRDYPVCRRCFPQSEERPSVVSLAIADLNHDGKPDIATRNINQLPHEVFGGSVSVFLNKGGGTFKAQHSYRTGPPDEEISGSLALGDLNGRGVPDLAAEAIVSADAAARSHLLVLLNRGDGSFAARVEYRIPNGASSTTVADLNADGKLDVVAPDSGGGRVWVLLNRPGLCDVQHVRGLTLAGARRMLTRANCRISRVRRVPSRFKAGRVISQKPKFGAVLPGGGRVTLVVSKRRRK